MNVSATKILSILFLLFMFIACSTGVGAQERVVVDKTVAVISDGFRYELITYSDLIWQLALQPGIELQPPRSDDLSRALQLLINQRIFALEAERLPRSAPSEREITVKINETLSFFPNPATFENRLKQVGFESVRDSAFERLIAKRVAIEKYIDFRFGAFVVVTPDEEEKYYHEQYTPEFRRGSPGRLLPPLDEVRNVIRQSISRQKIAAAIERFLDEAKQRVTIELLSDI